METNLPLPTTDDAPREYITAKEIKFSRPALKEIKGLMTAEEAGVPLRIFIQGGGCNGFQYGFRFDDEIDETDTVIEIDELKFLVDGMSYPYLMHAEIDYKSDLEGARFVVRNPNVKATCSCGSSFDI